MRPKLSAAWATKACALASSVTSSGAARWPSPGSSAASCSSSSTRRAPTATRAPSAASARAVVSPMPVEAPVTMAVLPSSAAIGTA